MKKLAYYWNMCVFVYSIAYLVLNLLGRFKSLTINQLLGLILIQVFMIISDIALQFIAKGKQK